MLNFKARDHVVEAILNSPVAKEAESRHQAAIAARRRDLATERAALEKRAVADFRAHEAAQAKATEEHERAVAALRVAKANMGALLAGRAAACHQFDTRVNDIENELRETADPAIAAFIDELRDAIEVTLRTPPVHDVETLRNPATGEIRTAARSQRVMPAQRAQALRDAIAAAEALRLEPDQDKVDDRLAALRARLPVIGALVTAND